MINDPFEQNKLDIARSWVRRVVHKACFEKDIEDSEELHSMFGFSSSEEKIDIEAMFFGVKVTEECLYPFYSDDLEEAALLSLNNKKDEAFRKKHKNTDQEFIVNTFGYFQHDDGSIKKYHDYLVDNFKDNAIYIDAIIIGNFISQIMPVTNTVGFPQFQEGLDHLTKTFGKPSYTFNPDDF